MARGDVGNDLEGARIRYLFTSDRAARIPLMHYNGAGS
jgi:hypothetical protein